MKPHLLTIFILLGSTLFAQESAVLKRLDNLIEEKDYDPALSIIDSLLGVDASKNIWHDVYLKQGDIFYYQRNIKKSLSAYLNAIEQPKMNTVENRSQLQKAMGNAGSCYGALGLNKEALNMHKQALEIAIQLGDSSEVSISNYNIGASSIKLGNFKDGLTFLMKAYEIDKLRQDTLALGYDLNALGRVQMQNENYEAAASFYKEAIDLAEKSTNNPTSIGIRLNNLSRVYIEMEQYDSAEYFLNKSIEQHQKLGDSLQIANRWIAIAMIYNYRNQPNTALEWGNKAKSIFKQYDKGEGALAANEVLIRTLMTQKRYSRALSLVRDNKALSKKLNMLLHYKAAIDQEYRLHNLLGNYKKAFETLQASNELQDSISSQETQKMIEEVRVEYEVEKVENEKKVLQLENNLTKAELQEKNSRLTLLTIIVVLVVIATIIILLLITNRNKTRSELLQSEINELRLRIKGILDFKPEDAGIVMEDINKSLKEPLSDREFEVLNLAISNKNNQEIADTIFISVNTVKYHLKNIYTKLGVSDRKEALKYAVQASSN